MAFQTYQDLQDAVSSWLNKENQETLDRIPDFITLGELSIFRALRIRDTEVTLVYPDTSDNTQGVTLPADFKEAKLFKWNGVALVRRSEQYAATTDENTRVQQEPVSFYREGNTLYPFPTPDNNAEAELIYYAKASSIATSVPQLYLDNPDLYLFAALYEARGWLKSTDQATIQGWKAKFDEIVGEMQFESDMAEYAGSTVEVSIPYNDVTERIYYVR